MTINSVCETFFGGRKRSICRFRFHDAPKSVLTNMLYGSRVERRTRTLRGKRRSSSVEWVAVGSLARTPYKHRGVQLNRSKQRMHVEATSKHFFFFVFRYCGLSSSRLSWNVALQQMQWFQRERSKQGLKQGHQFVAAISVIISFDQMRSRSR